MRSRLFVLSLAVATMVAGVPVAALAVEPRGSDSRPARLDVTSPAPMKAPANGTGTRADVQPGVTTGPPQELPPPGIKVTQAARAESWTPFSHSVPNADGTTTVQNYLRPAFTKTPKGWVRTDGTVKATPNDAAAAATAPGSFRPVRFGRSKNALMALDTGRGAVTLSAPGLRVGSPAVRGNVVTYGGVAPSADLSYESGAASVKQKVLIKDASAPLTYRFHLADPSGALGEAVAQSGGGYRFSRDIDTDTALEISPAVAYEADQEHGVPGSATLSVVRAGNGWDIVESVDREWLQGKKFPIVLDPTFTYTYSGNTATTDCYVVSDNYADQGNCGAGSLLAGNGLGGTPLGSCGTGTPKWCITRSLLRFPVTNIPVGSTATSGNLELTEFSNQTGVGFNVSLFNNDITFTDSATWNRYNSTCTSPCWSGGDSGTLQSTKAIYADPSNHPSVKWPISTSTLNNWINTPSTNHGVIMRVNPEARSSIGTTGHVVGFYSSEVASSTYWPVLTVVYNSPEPPSVVKTDAPAAGYTASGSGAYARGSVVTYTVTMTSAVAQNDVRVDDRIFSGLTVLPNTLKLDGATCTTCVLTSAVEVDIPALDFTATTKTHVLKYDVLVTGNVNWSCAQALNQARTTSLQGETVIVDNIIQICDQALGLESWWSYFTRPVAAGSTAHVNAANGNLVVQQQDSTPIQAHGKLAFNLRRTYNSQDTQVAGLLGNMGAGWMLNLAETGDGAAAGTAPIGLIKPSTPGLLSHTQPVTLVDRDGTRHIFTNKATTLTSLRVMKYDSTLGKHVAATTGIEAVVPKAISAAVSSTYDNICLDRSYIPPAGVHLSMWRYIAVDTTSTTTPCTTMTGGAPALIVGFATMRPDRLRNEFDAAGRLLSVLDGAGNELRYVYSTVVSNPAVSQLALVYEPNSCTLADAWPVTTKCRAYHFGYGTNGDLVTGVTGALAGPITSIVDPAGRTTRYAYDNVAAAFPVLTQVTNPDLSTVSYAYSTGSGTGRCAASASDVSIVRQLCKITDERGKETKFWYVSRNSFVNDMPLIGGVVDRRGTTSTFTYTQGTSTTDPLAPRTEVVVNGTQTRSFQKRDASGRFAQVQDYVGSTVYRQTEVDWDTGCRFPTAAADNNICKITKRAFASTASGVDTPDAVTEYKYNDEGQVLVEKRVGAGDSVSTHGYRAQYHQSSGSPATPADTVTGQGAVSSAARPSSDTSTMFVLSDRVQSLSPRGNTASTTVPSDGSEPEYKKFLTTFDVDDNALVDPNVRQGIPGDPSAVTCVSTEANTGLLCKQTGPYFRATTDASDRPNAVTTYTYDTFGQKRTMRTPKSNDLDDPDAVDRDPFVYHYYEDTDNDLSDKTSAGGWLKAVEDPKGAFVAFGYDRAGNVMRSWDRNRTAGTTIGQYPGTAPTETTPSVPMPGYAETRRGPFTGSTEPARYPWRYVTASRGVLCNWTTFAVDKHGNVERLRPPRGNTALTCDPATIAPPSSSNGAAFDVVQTFTSSGEVETRQTPAMGAAKARSTFDAYGNLTSEADPLADPNWGNVGVTRSANGHITAYAYDGANRRVATRKARTAVWAEAPPNCRPTTVNASPVSPPAPLPSNHYFCTVGTTYDGLDNVITKSDADGQVTRAHYDALQREVRTIAPRNAGGVTTLRTDKVYDADGHVTVICRPREFGPVAGNPGATGSCTTSSVYAEADTYDYAGRVVEHRTHKDPSTVVTTKATYDADGNTRTATDGNDHTITTRYDVLGRKTSQLTPRDTLSYTTTWSYDPSGNLASVTRPGEVDAAGADPAPRRTAYVYDADNRLTETVEAWDGTSLATAVSAADGSVNIRSGMRYDADGHVVAKIDPRAYAGRTDAPATTGFLFATRYDNAGQVVAEYAPRFDDGPSAGDLGHDTVQDDHCTTTNRPPAGDIGYDSDTRVCMVEYAFDAAGNRVAHAPSGTPRDASGTTFEPTDRRVVNIEVTVDNLVAAVRSADPANPAGPQVKAATYTYDGAGRQTSVTTAAPSVTQPGMQSVTVFSSDGLTVSESTTPNGAVTHVTGYGYDLNGNRTTVTDAAGKVTTTAYGPDGRRSSLTDPLQHVTTWTYDDAGNVAATKSPNANASTTGRAATTEYTHDNLVSATYVPVDTGTYRRTKYTYDAAGRQRAVAVGIVNGIVPPIVELQSGGSQQFDYLPNGRISRETGRNGETLDRTYDAAGHVLTATYQPASGPAVTTTTGYYLDGRVRSVEQSGRTTAYAYDGNGKLAARDEQVGTAHTYTDYAYNEAQLPTSATLGLAGANGGVSWAYDSAGRPTSQTNGDGSGWTRSYADDGSLKAQTVRAGGTTNPVVADWRFEYDQVFRLKLQALDAATTATCTGTPAAGVQCFDYDDAGRLEEFKDSSKTLAVGYDANGNRKTYDGTTTYYREDDTIKETVKGAQTTQHEYDAVGRLTYDQSNRSCYDGFDRLLDARVGGAACLGSVTNGTSYTYDAAGRQVTRTESGASAATPGTTTMYYDGSAQALLAEDAPGTGSDTAYAWAGSTPTYVAGSSAQQFLFDDGTGSVATAVSNGAVACKVRYDAFGGPVDGQSGANPCSTGSTPSSLLYRAGRRDAVTGTYQLGSRTYDPSKAAFTTADTYRPSESPEASSVGSDPLTANSYTYVNGDPVNLVDPSGHRPACIDDSPGGRLQCPNAPDVVDARMTLVTGTPIRGVAPCSGPADSMFGRGDATRCRRESGFTFSAQGPWRPPPKYPAREPESHSGKNEQRLEFKVKPVPGQGRVTIGLFISTCVEGIDLSIKYIGRYESEAAGNCRGFDIDDGVWSGPSNNKAWIEIDFDNGRGVVIVSPSCEADGKKCYSAYSIGEDFIGFSGLRRRNRFNATNYHKDQADVLELKFAFANSYMKGPKSILSPAINGTIKFNFYGNGAMRDIDIDRDPFPSMEIYQWRNGELVYSLTQGQNGNGPIVGLYPWGNDYDERSNRPR